MLLCHISIVEILNDSQDEQTGRSTPRLSPPKKELHGNVSHSTRFGFRKSNMVRPTSVGKAINFENCDKNENISNKIAINGRVYF